jgi:hypothetical protein
MAKFSGIIGYVKPTETSPGVWMEDVIERKHRGDVNRSSYRWESSGNVNDNLNISNEFSILADHFAIENSHWMRYIEFMGTKWKITNISVQYPRLILTVGGLYNGEQA